MGLLWSFFLLIHKNLKASKDVIYFLLLLDNSRKSPKSYLEILAEVRDYKRRRQSYRAKNVHITKKSYTEVSFTYSFRALLRTEISLR